MTDEKRSYESQAPDSAVRAHYKVMRAKQTHEFAKAMREKYGKPSLKMSLWDALAKLDDFKDLSDPDLSLPNLHHLYQAAAYARDHGFPDWMVVTALIHDLGKILKMLALPNAHGHESLIHFYFCEGLKKRERRSTLNGLWSETLG